MSFIELGGRFFNAEDIRTIKPEGYTMNLLAQLSKYCASASILWKDGSSTIVDLKTGFDSRQSALDFATEVVRNTCGVGTKKEDKKKEEDKKREEKQEVVSPRAMPSILLDQRIVVYRDGGSSLWSVKNPEQCGYSTVFQDGALNSLTKGRFFDDKEGTDLTQFIVRP